MQVKVVRTDDFTGGLNLRSDPFHLAENESPDMLNVDIDPRGGVAMRGAMTRLNTTAMPTIADGAFTPKRCYAWNGTTPQILVDANSLVYYGTGGAFTSTTIATSATYGASFAPWTTATTALVYMALGTSKTLMYKWSGSAATSLTASTTAAWQEDLTTPTGTHMPRADHAATHADKLWVASTYEAGAAYPNRVRWSHPFYPESWRSADYIDIVDGGSGITALVPFAGSLLVFKRNSIHAIYGYDTDSFQVVTLTSDLGVLAPSHVVADEGMLYMFSWPNGVVGFNGSGFSNLFSHLRPLIDVGTINDAALAKVYLSMIGKRLWLSVPEGADTTPTYTYVMDPTLRGGTDDGSGAWTRYEKAGGGGVACGCTFVSSAGTNYSVALHPVNAYALRVDRPTTYQDDFSGTPANFSSYYFTRWQDAGMISAKKMWRRPDFVVAQPTVETILTVKSYRDWDEAVVRRTLSLTLAATGTGLTWGATAAEPDAVVGWGQGSWGANAEGSSFVRGSGLGSARSVMLKVAGPGGKPWGVESISYKYVPRKVR